MRTRVIARIGLIVLAAMIPATCRAGTTSAMPVDVCTVIARPAHYLGKMIAIRGLLFFATGDAAPPPLLTGDCKRGILLFGEFSAIGGKELVAAEMKPRPTSWVTRRIWATVSGRLEVSGGRYNLDVDRVTDIVVLPNLALISGDIPTFPENAPADGGSVKLAITIEHGKVSKERVIGAADPVLKRATLENVKSWRFGDELAVTTTTTFYYRVAAPRNCPPDNPTIELQLPGSVVVTRWKVLPCGQAEAGSNLAPVRP